MKTNGRAFPAIADPLENEMTENTAKGRIVVGVDASAHAMHAAAWAAREAADRSLDLHLVHAMDIPATPGTVSPEKYLRAGYQSSDNLLDKVAEQLREQHPSLTVTTETAELSAPETLVTLSREAELVVTGTRGHGGFAGLLLGSVSLKTASHAHCPAVVVHGEREDVRNEIVLGVELGQNQAPIHFAFESAKQLGATVTVVRAWLSAPAYGGYYLTPVGATEAEHQGEVEELLKGVREEFPDVEVTVRVVRDNAIPALVTASKGAHLLVVGAHRRRGPLSVGAGYVVQGLLSHAHTPVAVVPIS